jgi:integrase
VIELPSWAVAMLKRRQNEQEPNAWQAVFTSPLGHLCDPNNAQADLRDVFGRLKYADVTSHTFRRTVATLMDEPISSATPRCR